MRQGAGLRNCGISTRPQNVKKFSLSGPNPPASSADEKKTRP